LFNFFHLIVSCDGTRFALADAGDSLEDANFSTKAADDAILKLYTQIKWFEDMISSTDLRTTDEVTFADKVFESEINKIMNETGEHYERTNFREAVQSGFFKLQTSKDNYKMTSADKGMKRDLVLKFIEVQTLLMAPITPHFSEYTWKLLGKSGSVRRALFPVAGPVDEVVLQQKEYLYKTTHSFRLKKDLHMKPRKGKESEKITPPTKSTVSVAPHYPEWKQRVLKLVKPFFESGELDDKVILKTLTGDDEVKKNVKKAMPFVASIKESHKLHGMSALDLKLPFDEKEFLLSNLEFIKKSIEMKELEIQLADDASIAAEKKQSRTTQN